ncbi:hypothetical protein ASQ49_01695 [Acidipropionibacterium acidipropionici]|nr:hypothetical protein ASQ49_01695 [Acidipropionibacterium acidipropionici]
MASAEEAPTETATTVTRMMRSKTSRAWAAAISSSHTDSRSRLGGSGRASRRYLSRGTRHSRRLRDGVPP